MADHFDRALRRRDGDAEANIRRSGQSQAEQHHGKIQFNFTEPLFVLLKMLWRVCHGHLQIPLKPFFKRRVGFNQVVSDDAPEEGGVVSPLLGQGDEVLLRPGDVRVLEAILFTNFHKHGVVFCDQGAKVLLSLFWAHAVKG